MAKKRSASKPIEVETYRHATSSRKNIPPAKIAGEGKIPAVQKAKYGYSAHLSPELRFDTSGKCDRVSEIIERAISGQKLTNDEADILRGIAGTVSQTYLEWSGKKEEHDRRWLEVDPVALHIHERVSARAIVRTAKRKDVQRSLFADPEQDYVEAVQFYQHDIDWSNRVILGDSLQVMSSLARREDLAGKVQMIYIDPPYGIRFASNFQSQVGKRDVKDKDADLTREPEMVKAYRDTWHLGVHSYLSYLRDRLLVARDLLTDSGSIFVQISDENLHRVRQLMDEVLGADKFVALITVNRAASQSSSLLAQVNDYLIWYGRDVEAVRYHPLFAERPPIDNPSFRYICIEEDNGILHDLSYAQKCGDEPVPEGEYLRLIATTSQSGSDNSRFTYGFGGREYTPPGARGWSTSKQGLDRLARAGRLASFGSTLAYKRYHRDHSTTPITSLWTKLRSGGFQDVKVYVVQTPTSIVERCMLMTTDPGDLVLDPTCGSGTTAYVAEQWGRRWITIDTSRVAVALARQRLLTARFDGYRLATDAQGEAATPNSHGVDPSANFAYKTVPHVTLGSIARNENLDPIVAKHEPLLESQLTAVNRALAEVDDSIRETLVGKLSDKMQESGLKAATDADRRRWLVPGTTKAHIETAFAGKSKLKQTHIKNHVDHVPPNGKFEHWHVPFDTDSDWPEALSKAVTGYRVAWRKKMDEVRDCIDANAEHETLVDQPDVVKGVVRVSGPFTVEGVRPEELSLDEDGQIFDPTPNEWQSGGQDGDPAQNASAYLDRMRQLISKDGVTFPNNEHRDFLRVDPLDEVDSALHAESIWEDGNGDEPCNVGIAFGPQYGPVTAEQVEDLVRASRRYDELVIAGFSFDGAAQEVIQESADRRLKIHMAHIRPDVSPGMDGLLKDTPESQLFTVFGQPEVEVRSAKKGQDHKFEVALLGVDIYSPLTGEIKSTGAEKVAAWFLDSDYDGRCFCITQAFFPNQNAWEKIAKALGSAADEEAFAAYKGTVSLPFASGQHNRIAVKVIDPRGNEVMAIRSLKGGA